MMTLYQFLETHLHLLRRRTDFQPKRVESLALGIADRADLCAGLLLGLYPFAEQPERIGMTSKSPHIRPHIALAGSHLPGWAMPGERILLVGHHRRVAHAGEEIVGLVVFADVIQTEAPVLFLTASTLWRTVRRLLLAAMPFTAWAAGFRTAVLFRLDADTVKKG